MSIPEAFDMGRDAFELELSRFPVLDIDFYSIVKGYGYNTRMSLYKAWLRGWDTANLAEK